MPEADTAWQKSRDFIALLHQYAGDCGAVKKKGFSQALYLGVLEKSEGICYGLSIGYILEVAQHGSGDAFLDSVFVSAAKRITNRTDPEVNSFYMTVGSDYHLIQYGQQQVPFLKKKAGLDHAGETSFDQRFSRVKKVADHLAAADGCYLIKTPNHAMASTRRNGRFTFFDPNSGEYTFDSAQNFKKLIVKYLDNPRIQRAYAGRKGTRLEDKGAHKTIHFKIDRFF